MPLPVTVAVVAPAVPDTATLEAVKPVTDSEKTTSNSIEESAVGSF